MDIIQIKVDLPPSYPIFDKFIFDKVLIILTSLPPLEFLTNIMKGGARSEHYYTAQIAVTCSQITVQTTSVF